MPKYLAIQIHKGALNYDEVVAKFPQHQAEVDKYLEEPNTKTQ